MPMKGKGMVDTFSINMFGSQKNIKKNGGDPTKLLNSAKSNQSMVSYRGIQIKDQSMNSKLSVNNGTEASGKKKLKNIIGKGLIGQLKVKLIKDDGPFSPKGKLNWGNNPGSFGKVIENMERDVIDLPIQGLIGQNMNKQTLGVALGDDSYSGTLKPPAQDENKISKSASFEDFKSDSSHRSQSFEGDDAKDQEYNNSNSMGMNSARLRSNIGKVDEKEAATYNVMAILPSMMMI